MYMHVYRMCACVKHLESVCTSRTCTLFSQENDPFWEPMDVDVQIGSVHVYLQSLAYMVSVAACDYHMT